MPSESIETLAAVYLDTLGRARRRAQEDMQPVLELFWLRALAKIAAFNRGELEEAELRAILERAPLIDAVVANLGDEIGETSWAEDDLTGQSDA